jgi:hypothetical protein
MRRYFSAKARNRLLYPVEPAFIDWQWFHLSDRLPGHPTRAAGGA